MKTWIMVLTIFINGQNHHGVSRQDWPTQAACEAFKSQAAKLTVEEFGMGHPFHIDCQLKGRLAPEPGTDPF